MNSLLEIINDPELDLLLDCIDVTSGSEKNTEQFKEITAQHPEYNRDFLWLLCYSRENFLDVKKYIQANYKKFHQFLDSGFPGKLAKNNFEGHMWELILCDLLSSSGKLIPKSAAGADFLLETSGGQRVQVEAIASSESEDVSLRSIRPDYSESNMFSLSGAVEDLERPVLLRFTQAFDDKSQTKYETDKPLIIAINTSKAVGLSSRDDYILRRVLFGLGCETITLKPDGSFEGGLQQKTFLNKPGKKEFPVGRFRDPKYKHVSGVIYTSQGSTGLIPGGWGWNNYGITFVPNPLATNKVDLDFAFFRKIICNEDIYEEIEAKENFVSRAMLDVHPNPS